MFPKYCRLYGFIMVSLFLGGGVAVPARANMASGVGDSTNSTGFGDTTWTAPDPPASDDPSMPGPRVAEPDRDPTWETALRTPFRVVFFPMRLLARGMELGFKQFGGGLMSPKPPSPGVKVGVGIYAGSANDVALGPTIKARDFLIPDSRFGLFAGWSITDHRRIKLTETIADRQPIGFKLLGSYDLKPNRRYFGIGNDTPESQRSYFRLEDISAEGSLLFGSAPLRQVRLVGGYSAMTAKSGWKSTPLLTEVFPPETVPGYGGSTYELQYGATGDFAMINNDVVPSLGVHLRTELRQFQGIRESDPDFNQWLFEGRGYLPVFAPRRVIAVRAAWAGVKPLAGSAEMPFYRLAHNEGTLAFAGYSARRFHDNQLAILRAEYRWELWERREWTLDAVALYELTEVAPFSSAFTWDKRHTAYGGGFRLGLSDRSNVRLDLAKGDEGLHLTIRIGNIF